MRCDITPKKERKLWIWITVSRLTRRILAIEVGSRGRKTLKRLWARLTHLHPLAVATDGWKVYCNIISAGLLIQPKALTTTIESVNSQVRDYFAKRVNINSNSRVNS